MTDLPRPTLSIAVIVSAAILGCGRIGMRLGRTDRTDAAAQSAAGQDEPNLALVPQTGHCDPVTSLAFSPDGLLLASGGYDGMVILWDTGTHEQRFTLAGHRGSVEAVAFGPNGWLASAGRDASVVLWSATSGQEVRRLRADDEGEWFEAVAISPDGARVAAAGQGEKVTAWDAQTGEQLHALEGQGSWIRSVAFSPDGKLLASGGEGRSVVVWDAATGEPLRKLDHDTPVYSVAFSPEGGVLASGAYEEKVSLWDVHTGEAIQILEGGPGEVWSVSYSRDGKLLAAGRSGDPVYGIPPCVSLWNVATGEHLCDLETGGPVTYAVAIGPTNHLAASAGSSVLLFDTEARERVARLESHCANVTCVDLSSDGRLLATGSADWSVALWDPHTGHLERTLDHGGDVCAVAVTPDGQTLISTGLQGEPVTEWDPETRGGVTRHQSAVILWDPRTGNRERTLSKGDGWLSSLTLSPDGKLIATTGRHSRVILRTMPTGELTTIAPEGVIAPQAFAFSPDSRLLAIGGLGFGHRPVQGSLVVWDLETNQQKHELALAATVEAVAFSPDSATIACGGIFGSLALLSADSAEELHDLEGHIGYVTTVSFTPDGRMLASGSDDHTIMLWDAETGKLVRTLIGHTGPVRGLEVSPGGRLCSAGGDGTVRIWDLETGRLVASLWSIAEHEDHRPKPTGEWIVWTPGGFYDGSPGAEKHLRVRDEEGTLHPASDYADVLRDPSRIQEVLQGPTHEGG